MILFCNRAKLTVIIIPEGIQSIESFAFAFSALVNVTLPVGIAFIGNRAFGHCKSLTNVVLQGGISSIGKGVFQDCTSLASIFLPAGIKFIAKDAFKNCQNLKQIVLDDSDFDNVVSLLPAELQKFAVKKSWLVKWYFTAKAAMEPFTYPEIYKQILMLPFSHPTAFFDKSTVNKREVDGEHQEPVKIQPH